MKLVIAWLGAVVLAIVMASAGSCSINHRSGDLVCEAQSDCDAIDRTCVDGYCIEVAGPGRDAGIDMLRDAGRDMDVPPDLIDCPTQCTTCGANKTCNIDCSIDSCNAELVCPEGWNCKIACNAPNACRDGIDCSNAASCTVNCTAAGSCEGLVCGPGPCTVTCSANQACRNMDCSDSCACDITCNNGASCAENACPVGCTVPGLPTGDCTSAAICNSCQ